MTHIEIQLIHGPLGPSNTADLAISTTGRVGARVMFEGLVRATENGRKLAALDYEAYEPMTSRGLNTLAGELAVAHSHGQAQIWAVRVEHGIGPVPAGGCSFRLSVWAAHRKEALAFMDAFIDRMKQEVPIWKNPLYA